jgi:hypothetical protein
MLPELEQVDKQARHDQTEHIHIHILSTDMPFSEPAGHLLCYYTTGKPYPLGLDEKPVTSFCTRSREPSPP